MGNFIRLYKTAKKKKETSQEQALREAKEDTEAFGKAKAIGGLASMVAVPATGLTTTLAAGALPKLEDKHLEELINAANLKDRLRVMKPTIEKAHILKENAYFAPHRTNDKNTVGEVSATSKRMWSPGIMSHEIGHGNIHANPGVASWLQSKLYRPTRVANAFGLGILPALGAFALNKDEEDPLKGALKGGLLGAVANAGVLVPEFEASRRGMKYLAKSSLPTKQKILNSLSMLPAFSTYLMSLAGPSAVAGAVSAWHHKKRKDKKHKRKKTKALREKSKQEEFKDKVASFIKASSDIDIMFDKKVEVKDKDLDLPKLHHHKIKIALERLKGGKGDSKEDKEFPRLELLKGIKHETEHTGDKAVAKEIAKDHLSERKDYYSALDKANID
jgi:hypothetical protein